MLMADLGDIRLHYQLDGDPDGVPLVFANSLGTDLRLWDKIIPLLPEGLRILRYDMRGHGLSDAPPAPYTMGALVRDLERLMDHLEIRDAVLVGLSIGGQVAQGLAVKRLDLLRGLVLSNTAAKIGTKDAWQERIDTVRAGGIEALADGVIERWFPAAFRATPECHAWRAMLVRTTLDGYAGCIAALAGADFYVTTASLRLPVLGIAASEDGSTPPDMVRETTDLVPGSKFALIRDAGHLPCIDQPVAYAEHLSRFLRGIGHVQA
ncbi:3-oxoadipate enol-lactonase [Pararhodobacter sp.]|uniref:3-oxoadipate enol-lactonase n=1 Tax=Pararhodobacter sp. TaxID=2127056 RepID=UPI002B000C89|nr:3-oxoadipate enol-lactonase [Pararhodobacter sp.]